MAMNKSSTYISFYNKRGTIRIFKKTIRLLGSPKFIRFQIHHEKQMLLKKAISVDSWLNPTNWSALLR